MNISRQGCSTTRLCGAQPAGCDPTNSPTCNLVSINSEGGQNFRFRLVGVSDGYIACIVSNDGNVGNNDSTYVCANNNNVVQFFSTVFNNGVLENRTLPVNSVRGRVNGNSIQCSFSATVPASQTRSQSAVLALVVGSFNTTTGSLGMPSVILQSNPVNLADPTAVITNQVNGTSSSTMSPATTSHGATLQQSLLQALLISAGVLSLAVL